MHFQWPTIEYRDETMREGMQIESADISIDDKVRLLDALGETGLPRIVVGSFVSPRYTPQMAKIEEVLERFTPNPDVIYTALLVNRRSYERARQFSPPLTIEDDRPFLNAHLCDVFTRRNFNRSQAEEFASWQAIVEDAQRRGVTEAEIRVAAAWGSNFVGEFSLGQRMDILERAHRAWNEAGIPVTSVGLLDPMAWCLPHRVEEQLLAVKERWPHIRRFYLHLHNARGMALPSAYAAMRALTPDDTLVLDGTVGGIGGCPYCGTGRATGMMATEDLFHMLEGMGIETGVDVSKLIDCAWLLGGDHRTPHLRSRLQGRTSPDVVRRRGSTPTCRSWRRSARPSISSWGLSPMTAASTPGVSRSAVHSAPIRCGRPDVPKECSCHDYAVRRGFRGVVPGREPTRHDPRGRGGPL